MENKEVGVLFVGLTWNFFVHPIVLGVVGGEGGGGVIMPSFAQTCWPVMASVETR